MSVRALAHERMLLFSFLDTRVVSNDVDGEEKQGAHVCNGDLLAEEYATLDRFVFVFFETVSKKWQREGERKKRHDQQLVRLC